MPFQFLVYPFVAFALCVRGAFIFERVFIDIVLPRWSSPFTPFHEATSIRLFGDPCGFVSQRLWHPIV